MFDITPTYSPGGVIGLLLTETKRSRSDAVRIEPDTGIPPRAYLPKRISAVRDGRVLLLSPREIRYAEAARHDVWLVTDQGRVRAAARGINNIEEQLVPMGFMRVHRSFVINLARIREVSHHSKGVLTLSTDPHIHEEIPVSRRCVAALKEQLGL
jgi:DNA-binding LytR/AlgR family response regulator